jgi:hypothetical protein
MPVKFPQADLPRGIRGGSDQWDQPQASPILLDDYFPAPILGGTGTLSATLGALTAVATGTLAIRATLNVSLGALVAASTGRLAINGTLGATLGALLLSAEGTVGSEEPAAVVDWLITARRRGSR